MPRGLTLFYQSIYHLTCNTLYYLFISGMESHHRTYTICCQRPAQKTILFYKQGIYTHSGCSYSRYGTRNPSTYNYKIIFTCHKSSLQIYFIGKPPIMVLRKELAAISLNCDIPRLISQKRNLKTLIFLILLTEPDSLSSSTWKNSCKRKILYNLFLSTMYPSSLSFRYKLSISEQ